ncbi:hypothetical protein DAPPUDRAFT_246468 [Daphnia pulex]|uniref:Uncharacterized protein n=1 Tax=Daphnia pulex TaxID=6669 RepID=E9GQK8_DAPPU|nr:hypothetical protein DAPPUDRAFT_340016 [Daphnia pulex]EFX78128.1 hypothetical protein DAPPUDRAFT_246468 [Daphnia pulex]|eukprot:EFX61357.1 hypothetical protein DAPPUDRAFT_340016 [Daphnia pulex]
MGDGGGNRSQQPVAPDCGGDNNHRELFIVSGRVSGSRPLWKLECVTSLSSP